MATLYDDDDPFDANGLLKDGRSVRISMQMRDAALADQRRGRRVKYDPQGRLISWEEEETDDSMTLTDGRGHRCGNRPGFLIANDAAARSAKQRAYDSYQRDLENAWRDQPPTGFGSKGSRGPQVGDLCTCRGPEFPDSFGAPGTLQMRGDALVCVPNDRRSDQPDPASDKAAAYAAYDSALREAWRNPK